MKLRNLLFILVGSATLLALTACAPDIGGNDYNVGQAGQLNQVGKGTIISKEPVTVYADNSGVGDIGGAVIGGAAASQLGGDSTAGTIIAGSAGAIAGGIIGDKIEKAVNQQTGYRYFVKTTDGKTFAVVQGKSPELQVHQQVTIIYGQKTRLIPYQGN